MTIFYTLEFIKKKKNLCTVTAALVQQLDQEQKNIRLSREEKNLEIFRGVKRDHNHSQSCEVKKAQKEMEIEKNENNHTLEGTNPPLVF